MICGEIHLVGLQHADRDAGRHPGIDCVAARLQHLEAGVRRKIVSGRNDVLGSHDGQAFRGHGAYLRRVFDKQVR
jgi:hypothetical protein